MAKSNLRLYTLNSLKDTLNKKSNWLDMGVSHVEPRFVNSDNITGARYSLGSYAFNFEDIYLNFKSMFTVSFWAKSSAGAITDDVYFNKVVIVIAGTAISVDIPNSVDLTLWNYFIITRDADNVLSISINGNVIYTDTHAGDFNLNTDGYVFVGNQNRYATGFNFDVDDFVVYDGSVDATVVASEYLDLSAITQILIIDSSGQVWGYSYDGNSSGGGSDLTTLSLTSEEDEIVIPDGITAIRYTLIENGEPLTRQLEVNPTEKVKYYKEEDGYYTLAMFTSAGGRCRLGYTFYSDGNPKIDITYGEEVNNNFTGTDRYVAFVEHDTVEVTVPTTVSPPSGITCVKFTVVKNGNNYQTWYVQDSGNDIYEATIKKQSKIIVSVNGKSKVNYTTYSSDKYKYYFTYATRK